MDATNSNNEAHNNTNSDTKSNKPNRMSMRRPPLPPKRRPQQLPCNIKNNLAASSQSTNSSGYQYLSVDSILTQSMYRSAQELKTLDIEHIKGFKCETKVRCCDFSSDGKLLASIGFGDKKVIMHNLETGKSCTTSEEHSNPISDVRFQPNSSIFATSSYDGTVRLWNLTRSTKSFWTRRHSGLVMSLDFDPGSVDILVCCDTTGTTTVWNVKHNAFEPFLKRFAGGRSTVRFQPPYGRILATVTVSYINIIDTATWDVVDSLNNGDIVHSLCWDTSGKYLASVSSSSARVWCIMGGRFRCIRSLDSRGAEFRTCTYHPKYPNVLIIGSSENLELWIPETGRRRSFPGHGNKSIDGLAALTTIDKKLLATTCGDFNVKLWNLK